MVYQLLAAPAAPVRRDVPSTDARNRLITENLDLVGQVVWDVSAHYPRTVDRDELWGAGALGLVEAATRYDPTVGTSFAQYARMRVRGAIIDSARDRDWASRGVRARGRAIQDARRDLEQAHGRAPSEEELAAKLGLSLETLRAHGEQISRASVLQLEAPTDEGDSMPETCSRDVAGLPDEAYDYRELMGTLLAAVAVLPSVQREVVERYYFHDEYLHQIAQTMGISEARVSQICTAAVNALRAVLGTMYEGVPDVPDRMPGKRTRTALVELTAQRTQWSERVEVALAAIGRAS